MNEIRTTIFTKKTGLMHFIADFLLEICDEPVTAFSSIVQCLVRKGGIKVCTGVSLLNSRVQCLLRKGGLKIKGVLTSYNSIIQCLLRKGGLKVRTQSLTTDI